MKVALYDITGRAVGWCSVGGTEAESIVTFHAYLATVARNADCECYRVVGVADHVHLAIRLSRTLTIADLVENLKTSSSKWLKTQSAGLAGFSWQRGYAWTWNQESQRVYKELILQPGKVSKALMECHSG